MKKLHNRWHGLTNFFFFKISRFSTVDLILFLTDISGRIDGVSQSIDDLSIKLWLSWCENIQPNDFCFGECWITADKYQHWERRLQYCEVRKEKEPF